MAEKLLNYNQGPQYDPTSRKSSASYLVQSVLGVFQ